jgi:DNA-binding MarR family transcriptional regulator
MKYSIHINQLVLSKTLLDIIDAAILDFLIYYCNSKNPKIESHRITHDNERWTWLRIETILEDMPLLGIKDKSAIAKRVKKIEEAGFIRTYRENNIRQYYSLTKKVDELIVEPVAQNQQVSEPVVLNPQVVPDDLWLKTNRPVAQNQQHIYDNITNDNISKREVRKRSVSKKTVSDAANDPLIEALLLYWNGLYNTKWKGVTPLRKNFLYWKDTYALEEMKTAVANIRYHDFWRDKMTPSILFRQMNPRREEVDYIGELLHTRPHNAIKSESGYISYDEAMRRQNNP